MTLKTASIAAAVAASLWLGLTGSAQAQQACGGTYTVARGDTLSGIADSLYKDAGKWGAIYQANSASIGSNPSSIRVGQRLTVACIDGLPVGLEGGRVQAASASAPLNIGPGNAATRSKINLVTADDYAPFTDRGLPNGGLFTDVVQRAMEHVNPEQGFQIHFVNDWNSHFEPLLSNALLDLGFPWFQPDCTLQPDTYRCTDLSFSEPVIEMLILAFQHKDRPLNFSSDADMIGRTLCRPTGYATYFFDANDRNWLKNNLITLETPATPNDCFEMLDEGEVDAVVLNEFTGRKKMAELEMKDRVEPVLTRPVHIDGLRVVVHKSHPRADELLAMIDAGLEGIRGNGVYQDVLSEHLNRIWAEF
ncbi:LysM peptidoglycan-binding domain-containing protein [Roseobacteraceae bacterium S113]